jgi:hypothetical protein
MSLKTFSILLLTAMVSRSQPRSGKPVHMEAPLHRERILEAYGLLPISFEPNHGQFEPVFKFASRGPGYRLLLNPTTAQLNFSPSATLRMKMRGGNRHARIGGMSRLAGEANYFYGTPDRWITHLPTYEKVVVGDVYPGVDVAYYGNQNRFEYDFIVKPGASPSVIDVAFEDASKVELSDDGDLLIRFHDQYIVQARPTIYQESKGARLPIDGRYVLRGDNRVGFQIAGYDRSKRLVIDPQLVYTYLINYAVANGIATDAAGNVYSAGVTADGGPNDQATNAYVVKMNAAGTAVLWRNAFGSFGNSDAVTAIAVDASGNAYVTGWTNPVCCERGFPTRNPIQSTPAGGFDAFITKFDTNGTMVYSTLLGGTGSDKATGIAVDSLGNIFVTGQTSSSDFPTSKPFQPGLHGNSDLFVTVLNPQGSAFIYSTYIGGSGDDAASGIAVDASGNAYVTGFTGSSDFPTSNPIRPAPAGGQDALVLRLNPAGSALDYSTYLGGGGDDRGYGIAVDSFRNAYVVGTTNSSNFPTVAVFQSTLAGATDVFVTKINSTGSAFVYSTYLGGSDDDAMRPAVTSENIGLRGAIAVNRSGNAYVTGTTYSSDFPQVRSLQALTQGGDAFITEFSTDGSSLVYSTLLGGSQPVREGGGPYNVGTGISADSNGNVYVTGITNTTDFPLHPQWCDSCVNPVWDGQMAFIGKLKDDDSNPRWERSEQNSSNVQYSGTWYTNDCMFTLSGGSAAMALDAGARATFTFNGTGAQWIGFRDPWSGIANVYIDGVFRSQVDTYSAGRQMQAVLFTASGLSTGVHTLTIEATKTKNASAESAWIWVDAFEYTP